MTDQFREVEAAFDRLKEKFGEGKISQKEYAESLKQLRIKDGEGRFWMIGAQSGKWYFFDGSDWVQAKPPSFSERKAICIYCGFENDLAAETCVRCGSEKTRAADERICPQCGTRLEDPEAPCPVCDASPGTGAGAAAITSADVNPPRGAANLVIRAIQPRSLFWFFGILGLFAGMLLGLVVGVTSFFPGLAASLPGFLAEIQGKLLGGIVFTVVGGVLGFVVAGPAGFLAAAASNGVLSLVGGLRLHAVGSAGRREDKERPLS